MGHSDNVLEIDYVYYDRESGQYKSSSAEKQAARNSNSSSDGSSTCVTQGLRLLFGLFS